MKKEVEEKKEKERIEKEQEKKEQKKKKNLQNFKLAKEGFEIFAKTRTWDKCTLVHLKAILSLNGIKVSPKEKKADLVQKMQNSTFTLPEHCEKGDAPILVSIDDSDSSSSSDEED